MNIKQKIKMLAVSRGMTLKKLAKKLSETSAQEYSYNSLLGKLNILLLIYKLLVLH